MTPVSAVGKKIGKAGAVSGRANCPRLYRQTGCSRSKIRANPVEVVLEVPLLGKWIRRLQALALAMGPYRMYDVVGISIWAGVHASCRSGSRLSRLYGGQPSVCEMERFRSEEAPWILQSMSPG